MNKNGFTLIELLGVIILLSLLVVIVTVSVNGVLNDSESKLTEIQIEKIEEAAKNYYISEGMNSSDFEKDNFSHCVNVNYLIENGYIDDNEIENFETGEDMLGSVRISYNSKKYKYTYKEDSCKVCSLVDDTGEKGISEGDKYQCKVKDNMEKEFKDGYYFYVLSTEADGAVNLIMDRNINSDGTPTTMAISEDEKDENGGIYNFVEYNITGDAADVGPVTVMNFLNIATSTWENIPNLDLTYDDEGENFTNFKITGKARLPYLSEVNDYNGTNGYLYNHLHVEGCYDNEDDYNPVACEDAGYIEDGVVGEGIENVTYISGYWTLSSASSRNAHVVYYSGGVDVSDSVAESGYGARPVITLPENGLKGGNW